MVLNLGGILVKGNVGPWRPHHQFEKKPLKITRIRHFVVVVVPKILGEGEVGEGGGGDSLI